MTNIFLERSYKKCVGETCFRLFFKKSKLISLDEQPEILYSLFSLYIQARDYLFLSHIIAFTV